MAVTGMAMALLWFHAFRGEGEDVRHRIKILCDGPEVPLHMTETKQLELHLDIIPHSVYFYLGRTLAIFGDFALAIETTSIDPGTISPFDTGGLVRKSKPVCTWSVEEKRNYLKSYSWPTGQLSELISLYPGSNAEAVQRYLDTSQRPTVAGPHQIWPALPEADIWKDEEDWRGWTWEARWSTKVATGSKLVAWSCSPAWWPHFIEWAERADATEEELRAFAFLVPKYRPGGVGSLVAYLRAQQAAA